MFASRSFSALILFALGFSGTLSLTPPATPASCIDDCTGCDRLNNNFDENETCNGCKIRVWSEMTVHFTNCLGSHPDCGDDSLYCKFTWTLKYKTTETTAGDCSGYTWTWKRTSPVGSDRTITPTGGDPRTLDTLKYEEPCGNFTQRTYTFTFDDPACVTGEPPVLIKIELDEQIGCTDCSGDDQ